MTAQERAVQLEQEAAALDAQVAAMSGDIDAVGEQIKQVIVTDEAAAKRLIKDRAKLSEAIDFARFKAAGLRDQLHELRAEVLREKLDEARIQFTERGNLAKAAGERLEKAREELRAAERDQAAITSQWANAGDAVSKLEIELRT